TSILAPLLREILKQEGVKLYLNQKVKSVKNIANGFEIAAENLGRGGKELHKSEVVVNCLWDGRLSVDSSVEQMPKRDWVYRLKYRFLRHLPHQLNSMGSYTLVLGPFGDVVTYRNGLTYLSWYPECMRGWSREMLPPQEWDEALSIDKAYRDLPWI